MREYICEYCRKEHDGSYGSGRFCSKHCRGAAASKGKKRKKSYIWKCPFCENVFKSRS